MVVCGKVEICMYYFSRYRLGIIPTRLENSLEKWQGSAYPHNIPTSETKKSPEDNNIFAYSIRFWVMYSLGEMPNAFKNNRLK